MTVVGDHFSGAVPLRNPPPKNTIFGDGRLYRTVSRKDYQIKTDLLREPRLKSKNRGGALSQLPLKITPLNMFFPPRNSAAEHHC